MFILKTMNECKCMELTQLQCYVVSLNEYMQEYVSEVLHILDTKQDQAPAKPIPTPLRMLFEGDTSPKCEKCASSQIWRGSQALGCANPKCDYYYDVDKKHISKYKYWLKYKTFLAIAYTEFDQAFPYYCESCNLWLTTPCMQHEKEQL